MTRKQSIIYLISSIVAVAGIAFYGYKDYIGICSYKDWSCAYNLSLVFAPIFIALLIAISVLIVKIITQPSIFNAWKKFAAIYIPIAALLIMMFPKSCGFMCFDREMAAVWLSAIYVIVSLIIIIKKSIKLRKEKTASIQKKP